MRILLRVAVSFAFVLMSVVLCIGYAATVDSLSVTGTVQHSPSLPEIYIRDITPDSSAGVSISSTSGTVMMAKVTGSGTASFTIEVVNTSDKTYVYERVIDGVEANLEGVYKGTDIEYELGNISPFDEIAPNGGTLTFNITITVPRGVTAENYFLNFNFIEKSGTEILPGNDLYNVTFKYNNGQPDNVIEVHSNEFVPRPQNPVRAGYDFIGWYKEYACTNAWNFEIDRVSGDMVLYAGWSRTVATEHLVTLKPNNGESDIIISVPTGDLIPLQEPPVKDGQLFVGWYKDSACSDAWNFDTDKVYEDVVLYGGWEIYAPPVPPTHNVTFKPNNGGADILTTVLTGEFIIRPEPPVKPGYIFMGWYTDEGCTSAWNFEVDRVYQDVILYGGWDIYHVIESVKHDITLKPNNGDPDIMLTVDDGELIPRPAAPLKSGYTFIGWYTDSACTVGWNFDTDKPTSDMTLYGGWEQTQSPDAYHGDFMGLVEALLSDSNNCLNNNDLIFDSVMESLTSKKRPAEDAPILHCSVNSVSGGTMSAIASYANAKLSTELQFIFEVDPNPDYQDKRMTLYMYYGDECAAAKSGDEILVYKQIVSRGTDGVWYADGTYIGTATVGNYYGGGKSGKDVKTISPYTWQSKASASE